MTRSSRPLLALLALGASAIVAVPALADEMPAANAPTPAAKAQAEAPTPPRRPVVVAARRAPLVRPTTVRRPVAAAPRLIRPARVVFVGAPERPPLRLASLLFLGVGY